MSDFYEQVQRNSRKLIADINDADGLRAKVAEQEAEIRRLHAEGEQAREMCAVWKARFESTVQVVKVKQPRRTRSPYESIGIKEPKR